MINKVILVGDVWKDPEERTTKKEGLSMCILSVVTKEFIKSSDNNYTEKKEWHTIVSFGDTANYILDKIKKGDVVFIEGQIQTRESMDGEKKIYNREIIINRGGVVKKVFSKKKESMELVNSVNEDVFSASINASDRSSGKKPSGKKNRDSPVDSDEELDTLGEDEDLLF